ncbi:uncharacterized protein LOC110806632 [Carica papaya]|uniref:uncharacterized protein LOC110806632 n=1 Tax=Carica papaya TaxID=3649 RepID=UPI000B8D17CB|nr:uncharacterized protein LOC110806632 [Carica papaya]
MLRKRTRSPQKDQAMSHSSPESCLQSEVCWQNNPKNNSFFSIHGLFVGLNSKGLSESDSVKSPTSPLDFRVFSNIGNPFVRSPRSPQHGHPKSWDSSKVGLSIVDSLDHDTKIPGKPLQSSESKNILFGPAMRIKIPKTHFHSFQAPKSLPPNYVTQIKSPQGKGNSDVVFEIGENLLELEPFGKTRSCSLDSCRSFSALSCVADRKTLTTASGLSSPPKLIGGSLNSNNFLRRKVNPISVSLGSANGFTRSLPTTDFELSEDYTCVISHGPNPKTTHIYGDYVLKCHNNELTNCSRNEGNEIGLTPAVTGSTSVWNSDNFLSFCYSCNKKLEGKDIYIYRGEKAFCSLDCRLPEILIDEEMEEEDMNKSPENSPNKDNSQELFETGIPVVT